MSGINGLPVAPSNGSPTDAVLHLLSNYVRFGTAESFAQAQYALRALQSMQALDSAYRIVYAAYTDAKASAASIDPKMLDRHRAVLEMLQSQASFLQSKSSSPQSLASVPSVSSVPAAQFSSLAAPEAAVGVVRGAARESVPPGATMTKTTTTTTTAETTYQPAAPSYTTSSGSSAGSSGNRGVYRGANGGNGNGDENGSGYGGYNGRMPPQQQVQAPASKSPLSIDDQRRMRYLRIQDGSGNVVVSLLAAVETNDLNNAAVVIRSVSDKDTLNRAFEASVLAFQSETDPVKQRAHAQLQELLRDRFRQLNPVSAASSSSAPSSSSSSSSSTSSSEVARALATSERAPRNAGNGSRVPLPVVVRNANAIANSNPLPCWAYLVIGLVIIALIAGIIALVSANSKKKKQKRMKAARQQQQQQQTPLRSSVIVVENTPQPLLPPPPPLSVAQRQMPISPPPAAVVTARARAVPAAPQPVVTRRVSANAPLSSGRSAANILQEQQDRLQTLQRQLQIEQLRMQRLADESREAAESVRAALPLTSSSSATSSPASPLSPASLALLSASGF